MIRIIINDRNLHGKTLVTQRQKRLLIISPPYSYRIAAFSRAAQRMGIHVDIASAGEHSIIASIYGGIHIDYKNTDAALATLMRVVKKNGGYDGIIGTDDNTVVLASLLSKKLGLPCNPPEAALKTRNKDIARKTLAEHDCPVPDFCVLQLDRPLAAQVKGFPFPAVVKPVNMSASRGVMRVDHIDDLIQAIDRLRLILADSETPENRDRALLERFIPGEEVAYEGLLSDGKLRTIALFDKPEPLNGPFFEESYYITPSRHPGIIQNNVFKAVQQACDAYGLKEGPVHAELRVNSDGGGNQAWILEVAARTIGGECSKSINYGGRYNLEDLVIAHATGMDIQLNETPDRASGVLMIPIPKAGILRRVEGILSAQKVPLIEEISIAIREGNLLTPLPEGSSYLGYIFASGKTPDNVELALRTAHDQLNFIIDPVWNIQEG